MILKARLVCKFCRLCGKKVGEDQLYRAAHRNPPEEHPFCGLVCSGAWRRKGPYIIPERQFQQKRNSLMLGRKHLSNGCTKKDDFWYTGIRKEAKTSVSLDQVDLGGLGKVSVEEALATPSMFEPIAFLFSDVGLPEDCSEEDLRMGFVERNSETLQALMLIQKCDKMIVTAERQAARRKTEDSKKHLALLQSARRAFVRRYDGLQRLQYDEVHQHPSSE